MERRSAGAVVYPDHDDDLYSQYHGGNGELGNSDYPANLCWESSVFPDLCCSFGYCRACSVCDFSGHELYCCFDKHDWPDMLELLDYKLTPTTLSNVARGR